MKFISILLFQVGLSLYASTTTKASVVIDRSAAIECTDLESLDVSEIGNCTTWDEGNPNLCRFDWGYESPCSGVVQFLYSPNACDFDPESGNISTVRYYYHLDDPDGCKGNLATCGDTCKVIRTGKTMEGVPVIRCPPEASCLPPFPPEMIDNLTIIETDAEGFTTYTDTSPRTSSRCLCDDSCSSAFMAKSTIVYLVVLLSIALVGLIIF
jgi:hypothetical protein